MVSYILQSGFSVVAIDQLEFSSDYYPQKAALLAHIWDNVISNDPNYESVDKVMILAINKLNAAEYQQYSNPIRVVHKI